MIKFYDDNKAQPTPEYITYLFRESTDTQGRFVFVNNFTRNPNSLKDCVSGGYHACREHVRYSLSLHGFRHTNAAKLLWIVRNDKPWPVDDKGNLLYVDHIDGNTENNFIDNIRPATHRENLLNRGSVSNSTSSYKGVSWFTKTSKWRAYYNDNGKFQHIGLYDTEIEAAIAYNKVIQTIGNKFNRLNVIP